MKTIKILLVVSLFAALTTGCSKNEPEGTMTPPKGATTTGVQTQGAGAQQSMVAPKAQPQ